MLVSDGSKRSKGGRVTLAGCVEDGEEPPSPRTNARGGDKAHLPCPAVGERGRNRFHPQPRRAPRRQAPPSSSSVSSGCRGSGNVCFCVGFVWRVGSWLSFLSAHRAFGFRGGGGASGVKVAALLLEQKSKGWWSPSSSVPAGVGVRLFCVLGTRLLGSTKMGPQTCYEGRVGIIYLLGPSEGFFWWVKRVSLQAEEGGE